MQVIQFLLVPDSSAARRLRRLLAAQSPRMGVVVGTWPELLDQASAGYLLAPASGDWSAHFLDALEKVPDAFWRESLAVAAEETAAEVESALCLLLNASGSTSDLIECDAVGLSLRQHKHFQDLVRLVQALDGWLPIEFQSMQQLMACSPVDAVRHIHVHYLDDYPALTAFQIKLINKLNADVGLDADPALTSVLSAMLPDTLRVEPQSSLQALQRHLYAVSSEKMPLDSTVQWVGVRDFLEEAEVAASLVQQMLVQTPGLKPADIGLLLPEAPEYTLAVNDAFSLAGLPLSGLPLRPRQRDLGREALFLFLHCRQQPAPAMALAACLSSPLMPWPKYRGTILAQKVMDGDYGLTPFRGATSAAESMLELLREGDQTPQSLMTAIHAFVELLDAGAALKPHLHQAKTTAEELCTAIIEMDDIDWGALRRLSSPQYAHLAESTTYNREGIAIWRETHEVWRSVRCLVVLGFTDGHYPVPGGESAVFVDEDLRSLCSSLGLPLVTAAEKQQEQRDRFKRQLSAVSEFVCFMVPRKAATGKALQVSESMVFMGKLFSGVDNAESVILELDVAADRARIRFLPQAVSVPPRSPRAPVVEDIQFGRDLLALRTDAEGNPRPESPSSLENLMISRLAWLLRRVDAEPKSWEPERPTVMLLGTLTHRVFEELFQAAQPIPTAAFINDSVEPLLFAALSSLAPFLLAGPWQVERTYLASGIRKAALAWQTVLVTLKANILATEVWLEGNLDGLPIHGQADAVLGLPDGRLLVVDYKRSGAKSRKPRMQKGYDSQANLYRTMLQTGGPKCKDNTELLGCLKAGVSTAVLYFMTSDQVSLTDARIIESGVIPGWDVIEGDIAEQAMALIRQSLRELRSGQLRLNRLGDAEFFDKKAGVKPYALDTSPLIPLFTLPGEAKEAE
ncbi:MAG: hypothetical protein CVV07_00305 [Gammaproteobacteria bacterium HGW-Gammaproteobacteria-11]|nr:MAG: hypothetical protein CVV07_00305 [Gammaproteobacteria bacterium HGW-Gammaproteobacteria-11]